jgi:hypothetical protein
MGENYGEWRGEKRERRSEKGGGLTLSPSPFSFLFSHYSYLNASTGSNRDARLAG